MTTLKDIEERARAALERAERATPGAWHVRYLDDASSMSLITVSTTADTGVHETIDDEIAATIVAATIVQTPRVATHGAERWEDDAMFIAAARTDVPALAADVLALVARVRELEGRLKTVSAILERGGYA